MSAQGTLLRDASGDEHWEVTGAEALPPFLVSLVSASDVWAYLSTGGGLSAGRADASRSLFPYETDDRLHHGAGVTGPITLIRIDGQLWQPFDPRGLAPGRQRILRKAAAGHWLELEERAPDLGAVFRQRWTTSPRFGLVRRSTLESTAHAAEVLDGVLNLMPADVPQRAQESLSALVDAYKRSELLPGGVGLFAMDARLSDQAAPAEALRANVVWRAGLPGCGVSLSADAVREMRAGAVSTGRSVWVGQRGAYLVHETLPPSPAPTTWHLVGDVHLDHVAVVALLKTLRETPDLASALEADIAEGARRLRANIASADGLQHTADRRATVHHFANVVFNNMRGGVFAHDHSVPREDLRAFLGERSQRVAARHAGFVDALPERIDHPALTARAEQVGDPQLVRLCLEYLPLVFSRRHGDPSRPWNAFSIQLQHDDGSVRYSFEGNWRDIFQNWEALCRSFPAFLVPIIAKFVNASTIDGFNPYRITRAGVDWEVPDPEDPWANIGYWGDHQVVYLFRLLEAAEAHAPGSVRRLLGRRWFSTADVPYRIRPYAQLCEDAKDTIVFDEEAHARAEARAAALGGDGRLVADADGVRLVSLLEKLLICVLAKLSNLVVDGGIWMNTQRPEWNDANNALVGQGLSVVTLAQLRRALAWLAPLVSGTGAHRISADVHAWFCAVSSALSDQQALDDAGGGPVSPQARRALLDALGGAFSAYRAQAYAQPAAAQGTVRGEEVAALCADALRWLDHSLRTSRRPDGLYHSYNLLRLAPGEAHVGHLYEMLEGQVNVLGSGVLSPSEATALLDALFASRLYRADQHSFLLYPFRERPAFLDRNALSAARLRATPLLAALADAGHRGIVSQDAGGTWRFDADFANAQDLGAALDALAASEPQWAAPVARGRAAALAAYEATFDHLSFTGRSGTMYKYEGLGSIYWHMVSKLLVSTQECWWQARDAGAPEADALAARYYRVRRGLSFNKSVTEYGAIPTDPYSHTPWHLGAQQPGMTGQVKEEILTRLGELGVRMQAGRLSFSPDLLRRRELLAAAETWDFIAHGGAAASVEVPAGGVAFTLAQVPVVLCTTSAAPRIEVRWADGRTQATPGRALDAATTAAVLARDGAVQLVRVWAAAADLILD